MAAWIVTCGPTEQREEFESRFTEPFRLTRFSVPLLAEDELVEFIDWFSERTGSVVDSEHLTHENPLLVQIVFEMSQGMRLTEFARRFRRRLEVSNVLATVQRILALNALYLAAPLDAFSDDFQRDRLARLSADDQRHFGIAGGAIAFAHPHLAGEILIPMLQASYPYLSWEVAWARQLEVFLLPTGPMDPLPRNVVSALAKTLRLDAPQRNQCLAELYQRHIAANRGVSSDAILPRWLECLYRFPDLTLEPCPLMHAVAQMKSTDPSGCPHPSIVRWVWCLADRVGIPTQEIQQLCWEFLLERCKLFDTTSMCGWVLSHTMEPATRRNRALQFLGSSTENPNIYKCLEPLVAAYPDDEVVRTTATRWLDANWHHPKVSELLRVLIARSPDDAIERWMTRGLEYLRQPGVSGKDGVLAVLLARSGASPEYIDMAIDFVLSAEEPKQLRDSVLFHLARACSSHVGNAMKYLAGTAANDRKREVARALATGVKRYPLRLRKVLMSLQNESAATVCAVLGQMVRLGSNAPELDDAIVNALTLHAGEGGHHSLLRNLARRPDVWNRVRKRGIPSIMADLETGSQGPKAK